MLGCDGALEVLILVLMDNQNTKKDVGESCEFEVS